LVNTYKNVSTANGSYQSVLASSRCIIDGESILSLNIIEGLLRFIAPLAILFISGVILIKRLKRIRGERWSEREKAFSRSVFALSSFYLITEIPCFIAFTYITILKYNGTDVLSDEYIMVNFAFVISQFVAAFSFIFPTLVNFAFNKMFRNELLLMMGFKVSTS
jgi:hypothetical protein